MVANSSHHPDNPAISEPINAKDDLDLFLKRYGTPDKDDSTLHDHPRPPIVTRFLTYKKERVKVIYLLEKDDSWRFLSFTDPKTNQVIKPAEVVARMKNRDSGVPR